MKCLADIRDRKGAALITAYMVIGALSILTIASVKLATTEYNVARRYFLSVRNYYLAEAGADKAAYDLAGLVANYAIEPSGAGSDWEELCSTDLDFLGSGDTLDVVVTALDEDHAGTIGAERERNFLITATATDPDTGISTTLNEIIRRTKTYTFQHAIFYSDDLELLPGRNMILSGKVHCNSDIYIGSDGASLRIDSEYLYSAGNVFNRRKDRSGGASGTVDILRKNTSDFYPMFGPSDPSPLDSSRSDWIEASQTRWQGTVKSADHDVREMAVPEVASIQPDGYFAQNADVKLVNGTLYKGGVQLVEGTDVPIGTVVTSTSMYDHREGKDIRSTDIDMRKLAGYEQAVDSNGDPVFDSNGDPVYVQNYSNNMPSNGLIYATRDDAGSDELPAVRIKNGSEIHDSSGATIVSNLPAYIQGDLNNINKKPVAIISDAVNVLSNNWDDGNSSLSKSSRSAVETTVNSAFIAGTGVTLGSVYGGGLENYTRLHEDWGGVELNIRGSFVELWHSQIALGEWRNASYTPPDRNWDYDDDFSTVSDLPAYTPCAISIDRQAAWEGDLGSPSSFEEDPDI